MHEHRPITFYILAIVFVEALIVLLVATPKFVAESRVKERQGLTELLSPSGAHEAGSFAKRTFKAHFVDTGIRDKSYEVFIPSQEKKEKANLQHFVPSFFDGAKRRFDGWWMMIEGAYSRVYTIGFVAWMYLMVIVGCIVDSIIKRAVSIDEKAHSVPVYYHAAKRAFLLLVLLPFFILLWPVSVHPNVWLAWGFCVPAALWVSFRNVQEL